MKDFLNTVDGKDTDALIAAQASFDEESYAESLEQTEKILQYDAENALAWALKGDALLKLGRFEEAVACFEGAAALDSEFFDADVWNNKGNALYAAQKYELASGCYDHAIRLDPGYKWAWRNKGLTQYHLRNFEAAVQCYDRTLELDPEYTDVWIDKGNVDFEKELYQDAISSYDKAISIDPKNQWVWGNKGWALYKLENYDQSVECYERASELDPNRVEIWNEKGLVFLNLKKYEEALSCFEKANEVDPGFAYAWKNRATVLENLQREEEAKISYRKALEVSEKTIAENTDDTNIWIMRFVCFLNLEDLPNAEKSLLDAMEKKTNDEDALLNLVGLYGDYMFEFYKALEYMRRLLVIDPKSINFRMNYVEVLLKNLFYKEARDMAVELLPDVTMPNDVCLIRLFILISYIFEGSQEATEKEFDSFLDAFRNLTEPRVIHEDIWTFKGMVVVISRSAIPLYRKFQALSLIDLLVGKIEWQDLTFALMDSPPQKNTVPGGQK